MSLAIGFVCEKFATLVADRRLTHVASDGTATTVDEQANKIVAYANRMAFAYAGMAFINNTNADIWLAEKLREVRPVSIWEAINQVSSCLNREFSQAGVPLQLRRKHSYLGVGCLRTIRGHLPLPVIAVISNHRQQGEVIASPIASECFTAQIWSCLKMHHIVFPPHADRWRSTLKGTWAESKQYLSIRGSFDAFKNPAENLQLFMQSRLERSRGSETGSCHAWRNTHHARNPAIDRQHRSLSRSEAEQLAHVLGPVKDADEFDPTAGMAVEEQVVADGVAPQPRPWFGTGGAGTGCCRRGTQRGRRTTGAPRRLHRAGLSGEVVPDGSGVVERRGPGDAATGRRPATPSRPGSGAAWRRRRRACRPVRRASPPRRPCPSPGRRAGRPRSGC